MTALEFMKARGEAKTEALAVRAGTTLAYFKQIAYRHRRPSAELAQRLAAESGGAMVAADLVFVELKVPSQPAEDKAAIVAATNDLKDAVKSLGDAVADANDGTDEGAGS